MLIRNSRFFPGILCFWVIFFPERSGHLVKGEMYARVYFHLEITERMLDLLGKEILLEREGKKKGGGNPYDELLDH